MEFAGYNLDLEEVIQEIVKNRYQRVVVQIPEGLKHTVFPLVDYLEQNTSATIIVVADPCFGACDLINNKLLGLNVDAIIHIAHTPIPNLEPGSIPTFFVNALSKNNVKDVVIKAIPLLEGKKIGIITTAQHIDSLELVKEILQSNNLTSYLSKGDTRIAIDGQILGCNFSSARAIAIKVDSFLFIGSGTFHPIGLLLSTKKPVIAADPYTKKVIKKELLELKDILLRQRYGAIATAKTANTFGVLIGLKQGQQRFDLALRVKELLRMHQKKALLIMMDAFSSGSLEGFRHIDCYVSTACPRIAIDDYMLYKKPIITPLELEIAIKRIKWEEYIFDEI